MKLFLSSPGAAVLLLTSGFANAQHDTSYYESYTTMLTGRFYFSQKYTSLTIDDHTNDLKDVEYHPNTTLNMGVGATYDWFTLNLAYGFGFLNPENGQGETKYLDLQAHVYNQRICADLFGQYYTGFYLEPEGKGTVTGAYYTRPDISVREIGTNIQYIFNHKRMSYRAAYLNNQWQKKSAGSFLLGAEVFTGSIRSDSSVYPSIVYADSVGLNYVKFFEIGPNAGYTYTLVLFKRFFITAALSVSLDYNITTYETQQATYSETGITPNTFFRLFTGYNSPRTAISITFTNSTVSLNGGETASLDIDTGNFRIHLVRRFSLGPKAHGLLRKIHY